MSTAEILYFPSNDEDPRRQTLRDVYETRLRPTLIGRAKGTFVEYEQALRGWERLTEDPPFQRITTATIDAFKAARRTTVAAATVDKNLRHLRTIIRKAVDAIQKIDQQLYYGPAVNLLNEKPQRVRQGGQLTASRKRLCPNETFDLWYRACRHAKWPVQRPATIAQKALLCLVRTVGMRISDAIGLNWSSNVFLDSSCPYPELDLDWPHGWLYFVPGKTDHSSGAEVLFPMTPNLRRHLDTLRPVSGVTLFSPSRVTKQLCEWRHKLQAMQGIEPAYTWQELRRTCNSSWRQVGGPDVARYVLGHTPKSGDTNTISYSEGVPLLLYDRPNSVVDRWIARSEPESLSDPL